MYTDPATGNLIIWFTQIACCLYIVIPIYGFGRYAVLAIRHNANNELPKPRFPWWAALLWGVPVAVYILYGLYFIFVP